MRKTRILFNLILMVAVSTAFLSVFTKGILPSAEAVEASYDSVNPIAKYEFLDQNNPGKDSMGNYNLVLREKTEGGTVAINNGVATFDGSAGLMADSNENDIGEHLSSFTVVFDMMINPTHTDWSTPVGFGWNNWGATKWCNFHVEKNTTLLRFSTASEIIDGVGNVGNKENQYYGFELGNISSESYNRIVLSAQLGGKISVYVDGVEKWNENLPVDFSLKDEKMRFALGGVSCWGNIYQTFSGSLKNVQIYDFAFSESQAAEYNNSGNVYLTSGNAVNKMLTDLFKKYYNNGIYQKDTSINLNEAAKEEAKMYFHAQCNELERTTYYNGNELWMTNDLGTINSGYGTDSNGNMTHFYYDKNNNKIVDYTVKIANKGGMEEYYNTIFDLCQLDFSNWKYENGVFVYSHKNTSNIDEWFTIFRDITAPCFLNENDLTSQNYLTYDKIIVHESNGKLIINLYVCSTDSGKLNNEELVFSQATISYESETESFIHGKVLDIVGEAVPNAKVCLGSQTVLTNENGEFTLTKMTEDENIISITADGFITRMYELDEDSTETNEIEDIVLIREYVQLGTLTATNTNTYSWTMTTTRTQDGFLVKYVSSTGASSVDNLINLWMSIGSTEPDAGTTSGRNTGTFQFELIRTKDGTLTQVFRNAPNGKLGSFKTITDGITWTVDEQGVIVLECFLPYSMFTEYDSRVEVSADDVVGMMFTIKVDGKEQNTLKYSFEDGTSCTSNKSQVKTFIRIDSSNYIFASEKNSLGE